MRGVGLDAPAAPTSTSSDVRSPTSTRTEVRSPTRTSTEVRSPTSTSTEAYTQGNFTSTVTGGAGAGANTTVYIQPPAPPSDGGHLFQTEPASYQSRGLSPQLDSIVKHPVYRMLALIGAGAGAYHGYKRNRSVGDAVVWGLLGGIFPVLTIPVSLAQGFGEKAKQ